ncbi:helix-turn-helix domain-containing protein [Kineococcus glutinatus]|uniref:helix-turn-helix domain-containing protein n=1 Tax=Kineococcus glutinatus TaxID=1070872 RepID=UPI0031EBBDCC
MRELVGKLEALDPDAGAALRVVTYFDQLLERRAGLESVVRGAAILSGHPAVLLDRERDLRVRVRPDGTRTEAPAAADPAWCRLTVDPGITVCLEHAPPAGPVEAVVLERAAMAARTVLERTRGRSRPGHHRDAELLEVLLDPAAPEPDRERAARRTGLRADACARVVAGLDGWLDVVVDAPGGTGRPAPGARPGRAGVGPAVPPRDLASTVVVARTAARFTAEGTPADPGPRVVRAEDLGGLLLLAHAVDARPEPVADVLAIERVAAAAPWALATLDALATSTSLRAAAAALGVHHSTVHERACHLERLLGWPLREGAGGVRVHVALLLRRLHRNGTAPGAGTTGT